MNHKKDLVINIKPHKIGKYLRVMFQDISEEMQNQISPLSNNLYHQLRLGDGPSAQETMKKYYDALISHTQEIEQLLRLIEEDMLENLEQKPGIATQFTGTDGRLKYSMKPGDKVQMVRPNKKVSSPDTEVLEDLPDLKKDSL